MCRLRTPLVNGGVSCLVKLFDCGVSESGSGVLTVAAAATMVVGGGGVGISMVG